MGCVPQPCRLLVGLIYLPKEYAVITTPVGRRVLLALLSRAGNGVVWSGVHGHDGPSVCKLV